MVTAQGYGFRDLALQAHGYDIRVTGVVIVSEGEPTEKGHIFSQNGYFFL